MHISKTVFSLSLAFSVPFSLAFSSFIPADPSPGLYGGLTCEEDTEGESGQDFMTFLSGFDETEENIGENIGKSIGETDSKTGTDAVLVIDVSGSMVHSDPDYYCTKAALDYLSELTCDASDSASDSASNSTSDSASDSASNSVSDSASGSFSRAAVVTFSDTIENTTKLTVLNDAKGVRDLEQILEDLTYTSGDTDIGRAMEKAVSILKNAPDQGNAKCILLLTDGEIDLPRAANEEEAEKDSLTHALMAVEEAKKINAVIHTVTLDLSGSLDDNLMNYMADSTGGTSNSVKNASSLGKVFHRLSDIARQQRISLEKMRRSETETEIQTEAETEPETEPETETETEPPVVITQTGTIDGPVILKGLLPDFCRAKLDLSGLFTIEGPSDGAFTHMQYTAYAGDNSLVSCSIDGETLSLEGIQGGMTTIYLSAQPGFREDLINSFSGEDTLPGQAQLSFSVEIRPLIPSAYLLAVIPAAAALIAGLALLLKKRTRASASLTGTLQWYVKGEHEKIFGMPTQTSADLSDYGDRVRISDLVHDELLDGAAISKVSISALEDGIRIKSTTGSCLIAKAGEQPVKSLILTRTGRFKIYCASSRGNVSITAFYTAAEDLPVYAGPSEDDERTRLLV